MVVAEAVLAAAAAGTEEPLGQPEQVWPVAVAELAFVDAGTEEPLGQQEQGWPVAVAVTVAVAGVAVAAAVVPEAAGSDSGAGDTVELFAAWFPKFAGFGGDYFFARLRARGLNGQK